MIATTVMVLGARRLRRALGVCALVASVAPAQAPQPPSASRPDSAAAMKLYQRAAKTFSSTKSLTADFEMTVTSQYAPAPRVSKGTLVQRPPTRFAFRFTDPAGDAIVADGEAVWIYLPSSAKGQVLKLPREAGSAFDVVARLLSNPGDRTQVSVAPTSDRVNGEKVTAYVLKPRGDNAPFTSARLWIGDDALVRQVEVQEPSGITRRLRLSRVRLGGTIARDAFTFNVPDGVRVIDQAALLGGSTRKP